MTKAATKAAPTEKPALKDDSGALYNKYRPREWDDVIGQKAAVDTMRKQLDEGTAKTFVLVGPSGTGKTTLARIAAAAVHCHEQNIMEIDAARHTGVDDMRKIQDAVQYSPMGKSKARVVILDECHMLSKSAWNSLLKILEEPPKHVYWFLCTTEPDKLPKTIGTRASRINLRDVKPGDLNTLLCNVCDAENFDTNDDIIDLIIREAKGSPRQALNMLAKVHDIASKKEAALILEAVESEDAVIELARALLKGGGTWAAAMAIVAKLGDTNAESVRIVVVNYLAAVLLKAKTNKEADRLLYLLSNFGTPYNQSERMAPLLVSIGSCMDLSK
jgi:DNA polymerase III gamma/tau subunit